MGDKKEQRLFLSPIPYHFFIPHLLRIIALILGLVIAAWGGVLAYRAFFLEPSATAIINTRTGAVRDYPDMLRVTFGLMMLIGGACIAFFAARRKPM